MNPAKTTAPDNDAETRAKWPAIRAGMQGKCPQCGARSLFSRYLKVAEHCNHCGLYLGGHQADDAPPYFTIFVVGHIIIPIGLIVERQYAPPLWVHFSIFCTLAVIASLISLPLFKGGVVGLQWALRMHGFATSETENDIQKPRRTPS